LIFKEVCFFELRSVSAAALLWIRLAVLCLLSAAALLLLRLAALAFSSCAALD
jgi:hypothetical protein